MQKMIQEVPEKYLSFSRIELVTLCPAKYKHRYISKTPSRQDAASPAILGTLVHKTLESAYQILKNEDYVGALKEREKVIQEQLKICLEDQNINLEFFQPAQQILKTFTENEFFNAESIVSLEQQFVFQPDTLGEIFVLGYIDRIDNPDSKIIHVVDYKTNRMLYTSEELQQSLQASIYIMAVKEMFPDAEKVEMQYHMLRFGIRQRTSRTDDELEEAMDYILAINKRILQIEEGETAIESLNKFCPWCEYRHICLAYKDACETDHPYTISDPNDIQVIAGEYEEISARAKIMYARKEELAEMLKVKLIGMDRLQAAGHFYSLGKTTSTSFKDVNQVITLLEENSRIDYPMLLNQIATIGKGKFDNLLKSLKKSLSETDYLRLEAQLEEIIELDYQPRLQSTVIRKSKVS